MKNLFLLIIAISISHTIIFSQGCLPEGITFFNQEDIDNFQANYPGCTEIEGDVEIGVEEIGSTVFDLTPINVLTYIHGDLTIWWNYSLQTLTGLDNLDSIGGTLLFSHNDNLLNISGLEKLASIGGDLEIANNPLLENVEGLQHLKVISGGLVILGNPWLYSLSGLQDLQSINTNIAIWYTELGNLNGLENITSLNGVLSLSLNPGLYDLTALANLTYVDYLVVNHCNGLLNLTGLENLTSIGIDMHLTNNYSLENLSGLNNLSSIGGELEIRNNASLTGITALDHLTSVEKIYISGNNGLSNLNGLENIESNSITNLNIYYNSSLFDCDVLSICDYLLDPSGTISIYDNAPCCNSPEEVEEHCLTSVAEISAKETITFFPNPATSFITIQIKEKIPIEEAIIFNHLGQMVLETKPVNNTIDVSMLKAGIYFLEVISTVSRAGTKLVIE